MDPVMPNYIVIDRHSGYIFFDTRDLPRTRLIDGRPAGEQELTPLFACRWGDETVGSCGRAYTETDFFDARATYDVYTIDEEIGGDEIPLLEDGACGATIEMVRRYYKVVATVAAREIIKEETDTA
jgi:hypothetical protein